MKDSKKTKQQLINELSEARQKIATLAKDAIPDRHYQPPEMDGIFRKAFYASPDIFIIADPENGTYIEVNESFSRTTGYSREELIGHSVVEINLWLYPEELGKMTRLLAEEGKMTDEEFHFRMKSGEIRRWLCSAEIVPFGDKYYTFAVATDITEQKRLQESVLYQADLINNVSDAIISSDLEFKLISWNKAAEKIYGWRQEEVIGKNVQEIIKPIYPNNTVEELMVILRKTGHWRGEAIHETKDGIKLNVLVSTSLIKDDSGNTKGAVSVFTDITKRRQAEKKHEIILKTAMDGFWLTDNTGKFIEVNDSYCNMIGYTKQELENMSTNDIEAIDTVQDIHERIDKIIREGPQFFETKHRHKDGHIIDVEISTQCIPEEERISVFVRDISERKQAEKKRQSILKTAIDGFAMIDLKGKILEVNDSYIRMLGYTREELLSMNVSDIDVVQGPEDAQSRLERFINIGSERFETKHLTKTGRLVDVEISTNLLTTEDGGQVSVFIRDITRRKQAEQGIKESEEKFSKAFHASSNLISVSRLRDGMILDINEAYANIGGYSRNEMIGKSTSELKVWANSDQKQEFMNMLQTEGKVRDYELDIYTKSGKIRTVLFSAEKIQLKGEECSINTAIDITDRKHAEEQIKIANERLQHLLQHNPSVVFSTRATGNRELSFVSDNVSRITGYSTNDFLKDPELWIKSVHPEDLAQLFNKEINSLFKKGQHSCEYRFKRKDNVTIWVREEMTLVRNENGEPLEIVGNMFDITERKNAEEALIASEEKFSKAFRASPDSIIISTLEDGTVVDTNDGFQQQTGFSREEVIGKKTIDFQSWVFPEDRQYVMESIKKQGFVRNREVKFRKKSGQVHDVILSAELIHINGEPCIISVSHDITERKKTEEALKENEAQLQGILRTAPIGIALVKDRVSLWVNEYFCNMTGYSAEELVGKSSRMFYLSEEEYLRVVRGKFDNKKDISKNEAETQFIRKNGEIIDILLNATPLDPNNPSAGIIATIMDITERKKAQERERETKNLRELDSLRTELLANVSHELRTPLASIKGFATVMMDYDKKLTPDEKREYLEIIDNNADRLSELIEQLLVMSRLGAGVLAIDKEPNDIRQLCHDVVAEARIRTPEYQFLLKLPKSLPTIHIDAKRIRQVMDNLIDNAVKNSSPGSKITISAQNNSDKVTVTIADQGYGIPIEDQSRIFDRMFNAERKHKTGRSGAGLGLSICKGLVEAHDGQIWIESEEGKGTRCFFTLPIYYVGGDNDSKKDKDQYHSLHR